MVKLINKVTGTEMWVAEERAPEYIAAGHKPVEVPAAPPAKKTTPPKKKTTSTKK